MTFIKDIIFGLLKYALIAILISGILIALSKTGKLAEWFPVIPEKMAKRIDYYSNIVYDELYKRVQEFRNKEFAKKPSKVKDSSVPEKKKGEIVSPKPEIKTSDKSKPIPKSVSSKQPVRKPEKKIAAKKLVSKSIYLSDSHIYQKIIDYIINNGITLKAEKQGFEFKEDIQGQFNSFTKSLKVISQSPMIKPIAISYKTEEDITPIKSYIERYIENYNEINGIYILTSGNKIITGASKNLPKNIKNSIINKIKSNIKNEYIYIYKNYGFMFNWIKTGNEKTAKLAFIFDLKKIFNTFTGNNYCTLFRNKGQKIAILNAPTYEMPSTEIERLLKNIAPINKTMGVKEFFFEKSDLTFYIIYKNNNVISSAINIIVLTMFIGIVIWTLILIRHSIQHVIEINSEKKTPIDIMSGTIQEVVKTAKSTAEAVEHASENAKLEAEHIRNAVGNYETGNMPISTPGSSNKNGERPKWKIES